MFRRRGQRSRKREEKRNQMRQKELKDFLAGLNSAPQQVTADLLSSLLKTAIADAEEIVASIKMRAQAEAEAEATRIVAQVKLEAEEIKGSAETAAQKQAEEIISAANRKAEIIVEEAKQKAPQYIASKEKTEEPVQLQEEAVEEKVAQPTQLQEEAVEEKMEEPVQLQEEVAVAEPPEAAVEEAVVSEPPEAAVEELVEERLSEERPSRVEAEPAPVKLDSQALYAGQVELVIPAPVELKLVSKFYTYLHTISELRILYTRGSWDRDTTITVVLDKPLPLIGLILKTPDVKITPELLGKDVLAGEKPGLLLKGEKRVAKRLKLILKEA